MNDTSLEYKGYRIWPKPSCSPDGKWYGGYQITKDQENISTRSYIFPGFLYAHAALEDSIEHAKIEIDHLTAMQNAAR